MTTAQRLDGRAAAVSDMQLLCLSRKASSNLTDINVRQTAGYKHSQPHSADGRSTTCSSVNMEPFVADSLTGRLVYA